MRRRSRSPVWCWPRTRLDVNGVVRRRLGVRKASFASAEETMQLTGMEIGGVTAFALPDGLPIWIDAAVMARQRIILGGGSRSIKVLTPPSTLAMLDDVDGRSTSWLALANEAAPGVAGGDRRRQHRRDGGRRGVRRRRVDRRGGSVRRLIVDRGLRRGRPAVASRCRRRGAPADGWRSPPDARHVHKIDSTLRGNWAAELAAVVASGRRVVLIPSHPPLGRVLRRGSGARRWRSGGGDRARQRSASAGANQPTE